MVSNRSTTARIALFSCKMREEYVSCNTLAHPLTSYMDLLERLKLDSIDVYINRRQLRWAGHVARMPTTRLPLKILSAWGRSKRPRGTQRLTYSGTLNKALSKANVDKNTRHVQAQDKLG